jgi:hypothetical protein
LHLILHVFIQIDVGTPSHVELGHQAHTLRSLTTDDLEGLDAGHVVGLQDGAVQEIGHALALREVKLIAEGAVPWVVVS